MEAKWVHVIGIAGVTTSGVAVMFKNLGWKVSGSDKAFFPPVSDYLLTNGIEINPGFKAERLTDNEGKHPDLIVYQGTKSEKNEEIAEATKLSLPMQNYTQVLVDYVIKPGNSIVVAGTYGKTTITAALIKICEQAKLEISYMQGGMNPDFADTVKPKDENTQWSIVEGDEYLASFADTKSKFFYYQPTHLILNAISWEHPDLFKTEAEYSENFRKLVEMIPENGLIVANATDDKVVEICKSARAKVIYYAVDKAQAKIEPDWYLVKDSKPLPTFVRDVKADVSLEIIPYQRQILGDFNEENLLAATVMASAIGIRKERIQEAIKDFKGVKRRLEVRYQSEKVIVIDDFGSSPPKAEGSLMALRRDYPEANIVAVFEPTAGNRENKALPLYDTAFKAASKIVLPRFSAIGKTAESDRFAEQELGEYLKKHYEHIEVIADDAQLLDSLEQEAKTAPQTIIIFLGSHSFRGMIAKLVADLCLGK